MQKKEPQNKSPAAGPKMEGRKSPGSTLVEVPRELELDEEARPVRTSP